MTSWDRILGVASAILVLATVGCTSSESGRGPAPDSTTTEAPGSPESPPAEEPSLAEPGVVVVEATIRGGEVQTANDQVEVALGHLVRLVILSDTNDELHVHGYDLKRPLRCPIPES